MFEEIKPEQPLLENTDKELTTPEVESLEKEESIEKIEGDRGRFFSRIVHSRIADSVGNWTPGLNAAKMAIEGALGKSVSGKKLSGTDRIVYGLESAALTIVYAAVANEALGSHMPGLNESAILGKFFAMAANIYVDKEFVLEQLRRAAVANPDIVNLAKAVSVLPQSAFSNKIIQLNLGS